MKICYTSRCQNLRKYIRREQPLPNNGEIRTAPGPQNQGPETLEHHGLHAVVEAPNAGSLLLRTCSVKGPAKKSQFVGVSLDAFSLKPFQPGDGPYLIHENHSLLGGA